MDIDADISSLSVLVMEIRAILLKVLHDLRQSDPSLTEDQDGRIRAGLLHIPTHAGDKLAILRMSQCYGTTHLEAFIALFDACMEESDTKLAQLAYRTLIDTGIDRPTVIYGNLLVPKKRIALFHLITFTQFLAAAAPRNGGDRANAIQNLRWATENFASSGMSDSVAKLVAKGMAAIDDPDSEVLMNAVRRLRKEIGAEFDRLETSIKPKATTPVPFKTLIDSVSGTSSHFLHGDAISLNAFLGLGNEKERQRRLLLLLAQAGLSIAYWVGQELKVRGVNFPQKQFEKSCEGLDSLNLLPYVI